MASYYLDVSIPNEAVNVALEEVYEYLPSEAVVEYTHADDIDVGRRDFSIQCGVNKAGRDLAEMIAEAFDNLDVGIYYEILDEDQFRFLLIAETDATLAMDKLCKATLAGSAWEMGSTGGISRHIGFPTQVQAITFGLFVRSTAQHIRVRLITLVVDDITSEEETVDLLTIGGPGESDQANQLRIEHGS